MLYSRGLPRGHRQTEVQRLKQSWKVSTGRKGILENSMFLTLCQENLEFHLKIHLDFACYWRIFVFLLTQNMLSPKSWSMTEGPGRCSVSYSFDISLNLHLNSWYKLFTSPGNRLREVKWFAQRLLEREPGLEFELLDSQQTACSMTRPQLFSLKEHF